MPSHSLRSLMRFGHGRRRECRYTTVRHQLLQNPTVPGVLEFLGVQTADRATQEHVVQRAVQIGWLFPPERDLMRNAGFPGV